MVTYYGSLKSKIRLMKKEELIKHFHDNVAKNINKVNSSGLTEEEICYNLNHLNRKEIVDGYCKFLDFVRQKDSNMTLRKRQNFEI